MILHALRPLRLPLRTLLLIAAGLVGVVLGGCTRSDTATGSPRVISPGMSESVGSPLLFQESRIYTWADTR